MENVFLTGLKVSSNYTSTENGAITHRSTLNPVLDMFAQGGAYRGRSEADCILLFKNAFEADPKYALKCLFYMRDIRGGQGERRFFRVIIKWLAKNDTEAMRRNLEFVSEYGRWDDLYAFMDTPLEKDAFALMYHQLALDVNCKTPSLLAKWLKSENTSSAASRSLATKTRLAFNMSPKQYRKTLSILRERIRVLERLMSENRWDEIEFDKIPSKAGLKYRNAFARRDILKERYAAFANDKDAKMNAKTLYPQEIASAAWRASRNPIDHPDRLILQKAWDNLPNYYGDHVENGIAVVDVSGSMNGIPMDAAISLGAYIAEKAHGPFANHFITFSGEPELVKFEGVDIVDKFMRCRSAKWGMNTNLKAVFDLLLSNAIKTNCKPDEIPSRIYIFSDMEFDQCISLGKHPKDRTYGMWTFEQYVYADEGEIKTLMEHIKDQWAAYGYKLPDVIFWNLRSARSNIPAIGPGFSYVSGFSPIMIENLLSGKDGVDLMLDKLNSDRYAPIH